jgi:predicted Zn-dependent peptidase
VAAPAPAPEAAGADLTAQLQQLAQLHNAGVLSDEEFAAAKQKLLAG